MTGPERDSNRENGEENKPELIADLLPRYYEAHGENITYEVERSMVIDGHEVAWTKYTGTVVYDMTGEGKEGKEFTGHELYCACHFKENVGWRQEEDGSTVGLMGKDGCIAKKTAVYMRHLELREEYKERGMLGVFSKDPHEELEAIMLDLMDKGEREEFLEGSSGARFWGGFYYLQTAAEIADLPIKYAWETASKMVQEKKISLEGAVVQKYYEPDPPRWEPHEVFEDKNIRVVASLPAHSQMPQTWQFEAYALTGEEPVKIEVEIPEVPLTHEPVFGPDVDDVRTAEECAAKIIDKLIDEAGQDNNITD